MKVLYIAAECKPFAKMGGVGDVAGELPPALRAQGIDVAVALPCYGSMNPDYVTDRNAYAFDVPFGDTVEPVAVHRGDLQGVPVYFIQNATFFEGDAYARPYVYSLDLPFKDDILRFSFFSEACLALVRTLQPDIVHINDWVLGYLFGRMVQEDLPPKRVLTVHNIGYQGNIWKDRIRGWHIERVLLYDPRIGPRFDASFGRDVNALRLALELAHRVNTVSPTYAEEITRPENPAAFFEGGKGLDFVTRRLADEGRLVGILNGYTYPHQPTEKAFARKCQEKARAKAALSEAFAEPDAFLLGFVGRAVEQKFRLLTEPLMGRPVLDHILDLDHVNVAILGTGVPAYEWFIGNIATRYFSGALPYQEYLYRPRRTNYTFKIAFDGEMKQRICLGSDVFLMPSLFEPCGIIQMESMNNATPPLVRWTGGLVDTVAPHTASGGTGFGFNGGTREEVLWNLLSTVNKARDVYLNDPQTFAHLQRNAFSARYTWEDAAHRYLEDVYKPALDAA